MKRIDFNSNWEFKRLDEQGDGISVQLPHDAMLSEKRTTSSAGGHNISWFMGGDYLYTKSFFVSKKYLNKNLFFEFEGVYRNAEVYINGRKAAFRPYGYTNFYVGANPFLRYGEENEIQVIARNSDQPNSRWYSGSGIYRPVYLYIGDEEHVMLNGIKIKTVSTKPAIVEVSVRTNGKGPLKLEILYDDTTIVKAETTTNGEAIFKIEVPNPLLWNTVNQHIYTCKVTFANDIAQENFGIRKIGWNAKEGLTINGERTILRGACIHHDNGLLGACCYPEVEERKIRILKENGYNAIRSAHNPCSKALLDACDRYGMLVLDEYVDMWYIHKTKYDYASDFMEWWEKDLEDMVDKDYNHPSVIMYSAGNEVSETAQRKGIDLTEKMTAFLHALDDTRPVTCGVNIFFNFLSSIGFGIYSNKKAEKQEQELKKAGQEGKQNKKLKAVGSEFYNIMAGFFGAHTMKIGASLFVSDLKTKDAFANMDIAGYNYADLRYKHDLKKYPDRLILGTETFCKDAYAFWELAKDNPRIIGDFVWAGMDYLGEAGIGAWVHEDFAPGNTQEVGWLTAGSGRIDITGKPIGEAAYTRVAFDLAKGPIIAVRPVRRKGKFSSSAWKLTDAIESWSWNGYSGCKAVVEVYARAFSVALYINGKLAGTKKMGKGCRCVFHTTYQDGEVTAVAYKEDGSVISKHSLITASEETLLQIVPETKRVQQEGLCFIRLRYTDVNGTLKPTENHNISVKVEGGRLVGLGHACPFNDEGYIKSQTKTYFGEALAIVKAGITNSMIISVADGTRSEQVKIPVNVKEHDEIAW